MKVVVGSKNPVKVNAVKEAFEYFFDEVVVIGTNAKSGVSDMPTTELETMQGAMNRAKESLESAKDIDFGVGLEGGIEDTNLGMLLFGRVVILDNKGNVGFSGNEGFILPEKIAKRIRQGEELGPIMDDFLGESDIKKKQGAIGVFTKGYMDRTQSFKQSVVLALVKFINPEWYEIK